MVKSYSSHKHLTWQSRPSVTIPAFTANTKSHSSRKTWDVAEPFKCEIQAFTANTKSHSIRKTWDVAEPFKCEIQAFTANTKSLSRNKTFYVADPAECCFVEETEVVFANLKPSVIEAYVASGAPMDKAGAYGIQVLFKSF